MVRAVTAVVVLLVVFGAGVAVGLAVGPPAGDASVDPEAAAVAPGSMLDPVPPGSSAVLGAWRLRVADVQLDAVDRILAANQFNTPPRDDHVFVLVDVVVTRRSDGPGVLSGAIRPALGTPAGTSYPLANGCGVLPDPLDPAQPVGEDQDVAGQWCWELPAVELPKVRLGVAGTGGGEVWFALPSG